MDLFRRLLASQRVDDVAPDALARWAEATGAISDVSPLLLAEAWEIARRLDVEHPTLPHLSEESVAHYRALDGLAAYDELGQLSLVLCRMARAEDAELLHTAATDTLALWAVLESFRAPAPSTFDRRLRGLFDPLPALAVVAPHHVGIEQALSPDPEPRVLLDHAGRALGRKLLGLERADRSHFQRDDALGAGAFAVTSGLVTQLEQHGLLAVVRVALAHLDFAKGGRSGDRATWARMGADLTIHNLAARTILEGTHGLNAWGLDGARRRLALALIESHGLSGQAVRGETPLVSFAPLVAFLRSDGTTLAEALGTDRDEAIRLALDCLHVIDVCDTAAVREGLLTDALHRGLVDVEEQVLEVALGKSGDPVEDLERFETERWQRRVPGPDQARQRLCDRLQRLRGGRIRSGEPREETEALVERLSEEALSGLTGAWDRCQLWYAEAATGSLSPHAQLVVFALGLAAARKAEHLDTDRPFHMSLLPLVEKLGDDDDPAVPYRRRLLETALADVRLEDALAGRTQTEAIITVTTEIGGATAIAVDSEESKEARALLTLLPIYQRKSSAAFHQTLKTICDLYGLRKDEFDRVANEEIYLAHMNSARSDKSRMLDFVRSGKIVEIGPGGGVVLNLLEERFVDSEILGIDVSRMVVEALERKKKLEGRGWDILEADAYEMANHLGEASVDTVIFCSLLHEIYSYVEYPPDDGGPPKRFCMASVRDLLRSAYRTLEPGGRIIIRDGVMPPPGQRIVHFIDPDARGFFELFVRDFAGRTITFQEHPRGVLLSSEDAMEFLYTYNWGPQSFPYEVREQYGIMRYDEYVSALESWLGARVVELPPGMRSYLQDGYRTGLDPKVKLFDAEGRPVPLPDSNCLIVVEKPQS